jgi:hypothetical protein
MHFAHKLLPRDIEQKPSHLNVLGSIVAMQTVESAPTP